MSDGSKIELTDATWNPITGCSVVSAGCKNCYAMKLAGTRLQHHPSRAGLTVDSKNGPVWTGEVRLNEDWLSQPMRWKRPRMIFVCAHADLFHEAVPDEWIDLVFSAMELSPQHTFQVLTKRAGRMRTYMQSRFGYRDPLPNVWLGVSVEDQAAADERIPLLLDTPAAVRWISAEPLLGPVDLNLIEYPARLRDAEIYRRLNWVVVGGESGQKARPMQGDWARSLRNQCAIAGVPFLFKQWGEWIDGDQADSAANDKLWAKRSHFDMLDAGLIAKIPPKPMGPPFFGCDYTVRLGKKAAGRLLDGVTHDGYPEVGAA